MLSIERKLRQSRVATEKRVSRVFPAICVAQILATVDYILSNLYTYVLYIGKQERQTFIKKKKKIFLTISHRSNIICEIGKEQCTSLFYSIQCKTPFGYNIVPSINQQSYNVRISRHDASDLENPNEFVSSKCEDVCAVDCTKLRVYLDSREIKKNAK